MAASSASSSRRSPAARRRRPTGTPTASGTATELGGRADEQGRPVEISAKVIVRMATIGEDGPTGTFQEDDGELSW